MATTIKHPLDPCAYRSIKATPLFRPSECSPMNPLMASSRILFAAFVLVGLASRSFGQDKGEMQYEAKLLHKLPLETHGFPGLKETDAGLTLVVPLRSKKQAMESDAISFWNVPDNKEDKRVLNPGKTQKMKGGVPAWSVYGLPWQWEISPDGKKLAMPRTDFVAVKASHSIELYDFANKKATPMPAGQLVAPPWIAFLPNGEMVIVTHGSAAIQKIGAAKPRLVLKVPVGKFVPLFRWQGTTAELSTDGSKLAVCQMGMLSVFDTKTGKSLLQLARDVTENKSLNQPALVSFFRSMTFAGPTDNPKLLTVEHEATEKNDMLVARVLDLKTKEEISKKTLVEKPAELTENPPGMRTFFSLAGSSHAGYPFVDAKSQPRILYNGKIYDPATGYVLGEFDPGLGARVSRDGKYIVRLTSVEGEKDKKRIEIWSLSSIQK